METLVLQNITKDYPGVKALDNVSISFEQGEVHALVGENGAGKSTFIKTISGAIQPTSGKIIFEGKEYPSMNPTLSRQLGIAVVYQELIQFDAMSIADNIFMGTNVGVHNGVVNSKEREQKAAELLKNFGCHIPTSTWIRELSVANRQIVEIAKAMSQDAKVVIMDEPTAAITVEEQKNLFKIVRMLKEKKVTVIYISHRMEELYEICDRVTVLRDGQYVDTLKISDIDKQGLINLMVGRELSETYPAVDPAGEEVVLEVEHLSGNGLTDISFQLHKGEILGFAGLVGAGRTELMHLLFGAAAKESGSVKINGKEVDIKTPSEGLKAGIGLIPEDRKVQGCFLDKEIFWNISISNLKDMCRGLVINKSKEMKQAEEYRKMVRIKTPSNRQRVVNLSGGNQQKVVVSKVLAVGPDIIIFDEPTRGIDVGARYEIYTMMVELARQGKSILMVSSDMEELLGMSQRIVVLHEGHLTGILDRKDATQEKVLTLASGL